MVFVPVVATPLTGATLAWDACPGPLARACEPTAKSVAATRPAPTVSLPTIDAMAMLLRLYNQVRRQAQPEISDDRSWLPAPTHATSTDPSHRPWRFFRGGTERRTVPALRLAQMQWSGPLWPDARH